MKEHINQYKEKLEKAIIEYMGMPASERSATAIMSMVDCWAKLDTMCDDKHGKTEMLMTRADADTWNAMMHNVDGSTGGHWTIEQTNGVASSVNVTFDHIPDWMWNVAMNMMYSDYGNVAAYYGVSTAEFYGEMTKAFLFDPDGPGPKEKMSAYWCWIVKPHKDTHSGY